MFSLGIIVYQLLTGLHPIYRPGDDLDAIREKILDVDSLPLWSRQMWAFVSVPAMEVCRMMMRSRPGERPGAVDLLGHAWFKKSTCKATAMTASVWDGLSECAERALFAENPAGHIVDGFFSAVSMPNFAFKA